jgi:hypothetical protein
MRAPQWVLVSWAVFELGYALAKNGQPVTIHYSFVHAFLFWSMLAAILWSGGFFRRAPTK